MHSTSPGSTKYITIKDIKVSKFNIEEMPTMVTEIVIYILQNTLLRLYGGPLVLL